MKTRIMVRNLRPNFNGVWVTTGRRLKADGPCPPPPGERARRQAVGDVR